MGFNGIRNGWDLRKDEISNEEDEAANAAVEGKDDAGDAVAVSFARLLASDSPSSNGRFTPAIDVDNDAAGAGTDAGVNDDDAAAAGNPFDEVADDDDATIGTGAAAGVGFFLALRLNVSPGTSASAAGSSPFAAAVEVAAGLLTNPVHGT
jgi:hypothetical protein